METLLYTLVIVVIAVAVFATGWQASKFYHLDLTEREIATLFRESGMTLDNGKIVEKGN